MKLQELKNLLEDLPDDAEVYFDEDDYDPYIGILSCGPFPHQSMSGIESIIGIKIPRKRIL